MKKSASALSCLTEVEMAIVNKILAQLTPGANLTDAYIARNGVTATASVAICNTSVFAETIRISLAVKGAVDDLKQYIEFNKVIEANTSYSTNGLYLQPGDVIRVWASSGEVSFNILGTESN